MATDEHQNVPLADNLLMLEIIAIYVVSVIGVVYILWDDLELAFPDIFIQDNIHKLDMMFSLRWVWSIYNIFWDATMCSLVEA
jgi:hypothetical protein